MRLVLAALLMSLSSSAHANDAELRQKIVGTWTLVSVVYEDQGTKELTPVLGEKPRGRQIATADGRWLALVTAENRPVPKTDEDRARALTSMIAYTGRYRVEDGKVVTKVEAAWNEAWVGGEQTRFIRFEGDRLFIESPPMPHPNVNNKVVKVIVIWIRSRASASCCRPRESGDQSTEQCYQARPHLNLTVFTGLALSLCSVGRNDSACGKAPTPPSPDKPASRHWTRDVARALGLQFLQRLDRIECRVREDYIVTADQW
jgi:hypothetical protein